MKTNDVLLTRTVLVLLRFPKTGLFLLAVLVLSLLWQTQHLRFDNSTESFLNKNDPQRLAYIAFENKYGLSAYFIVFIRDPDLLTKQGIERVHRLQQAIDRTVPHVAETESIVSSRYIHSDGDDIAIEPLFEGSLSVDEIKKRRQRALNTPYYLNRLINKTADASAIIVRLRQYGHDGDGRLVRLQMYHIQETLDSLKSVIADQQQADKPPVLLGGSPMITAELTRSTRHDMLLFSMLAVLVVALTLYAMFRRLSAVCMPLVCLFATVAIVLSMMAIGRFPLQVSSAILPSFLMAVGVADCIHFLQAFYSYHDHGRGRQVAIRSALNHVGIAMFFTTLTTSAGLSSFAFSNVAPVASFGLFSAIGVWVAFVLTLFALPALLLIFPVGQRPQVKMSHARQRQGLTAVIERINRWRTAILSVAFILLVVFVALAGRLHFSYNPLLWFEHDHPVRQTNRMIEASLSGTMQVELLITRQDKQALQLAQLQQIDRWLADIRHQPPEGIPVSSAVSVLDLLKEMNRVLQPGAGYTLPETQPLLAQETLLLRFDPDNTLEQLIDNSFSEMRISLSIPWMDSVAYTAFLDELSNHFHQHVGNKLSLQMTGMATVANKAFTEMIASMGSSYLYAGIAVLSLMILLVRRVKLGLLLILPNILPVAAVLAVMWLLSIPLDLFTMLIGSIAIGLIVDDSIHFVYTFQRLQANGSPTIPALVETFISTGRALVSTTLVLCAAFSIYSFSSLQNLALFGLLTALCIALALAADLLLIPAILLRLNQAETTNPHHEE